MREHGIFATNARVTRECEIQSPTETEASNRGDERLARVRDGVHGALAAAREFKTFAAIERREFGDFCASGESLLRAGDYASAEIRIARQPKRFPLQ